MFFALLLTACGAPTPGGADLADPTVDYYTWDYACDGRDALAADAPAFAPPEGVEPLFVSHVTLNSDDAVTGAGVWQSHNLEWHSTGASVTTYCDVNVRGRVTIAYLAAE